LGYFRSDAIQLKTKISLYPDQDLRMEWLEIIGSNSIQIFYVFSSILLAISGAICFSIGIPVFKLAKKRQEIEKILIEKTDMQNKLTSEINMKRQEIAKAKTDQEIAEQQLNLLDDKVNLQTSLDKAFQEELKIWESMFENQTKAEISWYEEGRKRGNKYTLADELIISLYDFPNGGYKQSENRSKEEGNPVPPVNGKYLHEKVRSLIDYNLNRKPKLNGHNE
jgi:hypothetical protein